MKKNLAFALALMMAVSLAACGGKEGTKTAGGGSGTGDTVPANARQEQPAAPDAAPPSKAADQGKAKKPAIPVDDITTENWKQVVKENYELTITLPDGWEIKEAESLDGAHLKFSCNATMEDTAAFFDSIFVQLKELGAVRITDHGGDKAWNSYSEANTGGYQTNFDVAMNSDWSKDLYMDFGYQEALDKDANFYVDEVKLYLDATGDWSLPTGDNGYVKLEAYTGLSSVTAPDGYLISSSSKYSEDSVTLSFCTDGSEPSESELDAYAAKIWELSVKAADGGKCFWYNKEKNKITKEYGSAADVKKSDKQYDWFYKRGGEYVYIKVYRTKNNLYVYAADHA